MLLAIAQINCTPGDTAANIQKMLDFTAQAAAAGAAWVVFPELADTAYILPDVLEWASDWTNGAPLTALRQAAQKNAIGIIAGLTERSAEGTYNSLAVIDARGQVAASYRKLHLFYPAGEGAFQAGNQLVRFKYGDWTFGLSICYDLRFPELYRQLAGAGADVLINAAAWPFPRVGHWNTLLAARAIENQCYMIGANRCGRDKGAWFCGHSQIIDPYGTILASAAEDREQLVLAQLERDRLQQVRQKMPVWEHRRL